MPVGQQSITTIALSFVPLDRRLEIDSASLVRRCTLSSPSVKPDDT